MDLACPARVEGSRGSFADCQKTAKPGTCQALGRDPGRIPVKDAEDLCALVAELLG